MTNSFREKPRIVALAHSPFVGGGELALKSLIESTINTYEWVVVIPSHVKADPATVVPDVSYVNLPSLPWWCHEAHDSPSRINKSQFHKSLNSLRQIAQNADILLTNTITIPWLGFVAQEIQKPHIWYVHEYGDIDHNLQFIVGYDVSLRLIAECSNRVMTISSAVKEHLGRVIPEDKIDIIHQSIDLADLTSIPVSTSFEKISLLCMGAIKPSKGQHIALEAVSKLPNVTLDIIGPAADHQFANDLQQKAKNIPNVSVQIRRYNPFTELSSHNVVLMCSANEGLGRVTLEGLAAGRLVVGYDCQSTRELLSGNRGILYPHNNPTSLSKAIQAIGDKVASIDLNNGRSYVCQEFNQDNQAKDFNLCVDKALSSHTVRTSSLEIYLRALNKLNLWESPLLKIIAVLKRIAPSRIRKLIKNALTRARG